MRRYSQQMRKRALVPASESVGLFSTLRGPTYHPDMPSVLAVFMRQSIGFLYSRPRGFPSGPMAFGDWLYMRVRAVSVRKSVYDDTRARKEPAPAGCIMTRTQMPEKEEARR